MMIKPALFAAALVGMTAISAGNSTAWSAPGYHSWKSHHAMRTQTKCVGTRRVVMRINSSGDVVSRRVVGRCFTERFWKRLNKN